ncbi:hypothetical protein EHM69_01190 [candidate division KSB1 bacterium]|nr:MAG: hypothetical protein EHM69_01190 [candidate division KSB1 bacterium]
MKKIIVLLVLTALVLQGCAVFQPSKKGAKPEGFGVSRVSDLVVKAAVDSLIVELGLSGEIPVDVTWAADQKYAVQLAAAAGTPNWLNVEFQPSIVNPPGRAIVKVSPRLGEAAAGSIVLTIEGSAFGLNEPVRTTVRVIVRRQAGEFAPLLAAPITVECRNICGIVNEGRLAFYDVLREKGQTCGDGADLPASQRIGLRSYTITGHGFGFGRSCRLAGMYDTAGFLTFVNLGISTLVPRGGIMLAVRSASDCWLSADNTVALVIAGGYALPFDVLTGVELGRPVRVSDTLPVPTLMGTTLTAGSFTWEIQ